MRKFGTSSLEDLYTEIRNLKKQVNQLQGRNEVTLPLRSATNLPPGIENQLVIADDGKVYKFQDGDWAPLGGGLGIVFFSQPGALQIVTGSMPWFALEDGEIDYCNATVGIAPTGSFVTVQLRKNATPIGSGNILATTQNIQFTPSPTVYVAGDIFTMDVTHIGSTVSGSDLDLQVKIK